LPSSSPPSTARRPRSRYLPGGKPARAYPLTHIAEGAAILAALDRHGLLTNGQVRDLLFADGPNRDGSPRGPAYARKLANLSLWRLWEGGLVRRQSAILTSPRTGGPYLHFYNVLSPVGARAVAEHLAEADEGAPRWSRSIYDLGPQQVDHSLLINDVYIRAVRAARSSGTLLRDWQDDRQLVTLRRDGQAHFVTVPDGYFVLERAGRAYGHFLEVARGTEPQTSQRRPDKAWTRKIEGYGRYLTRLIAADAAHFDGYTTPRLMLCDAGVQSAWQENPPQASAKRLSSAKPTARTCEFMLPSQVYVGVTDDVAGRHQRQATPIPKGAQAVRNALHGDTLAKIEVRRA